MVAALRAVDSKIAMVNAPRWSVCAPRSTSCPTALSVPP